MRIAAHGTPTIFEEAIPGEHQPESVTWTGGEVAIASGGRPDRCAFRPVDGGGGEEQVVELEDHGDVTHPFAPWQWSGEPDVAAPAVVTCPGELTSCTAWGADGAERVLVLHAHPGPWHDNAWNPSEGTDIRHPFADEDFWIGTPDVDNPATISCSHDAQLYGGGEIATWFRYDETSPRLVHATAVPIGWLLFALVAWVLAGP